MLFCAAVAGLRGAVGGAVATDGTVGPVKALAGPNFAVTPDLGQQRGGNLFHNFRQFDLSKGESATFSGPPSVRNVLTRVTGGSPSSIDGTIRCTIPDANFYLVNPVGVVFGPDAKLDVQGSFAVATADEVGLEDGGRFAARGTADSVLTVADPSAFGFLGPRPAEVTSGPTALAAPDGKTLRVEAGRVRVTGGSLLASGGGTLRVSGQAVELSGGANLRADGAQASVSAGRLSVTGESRIATYASSHDPGGKSRSTRARYW
jgi:filamentous hemagglutinin family protein